MRKCPSLKPLFLALILNWQIWTDGVFFPANPPQNSFRRIRNASPELVVGKFYKPEELKARGFQLAEITLLNLEQIFGPLPSNENFLIYEIIKEGKVVGWLWREIFLDRRALENRFRLFIDAHARMDEILNTGNLVGDALLKLMDVRKRIFLWAALFKWAIKHGSSLVWSFDVNEVKAETLMDIEIKKMLSGEHSDFIIGQKNFGLIKIKNKNAELSYRLVYLKDYVSGRGIGPSLDSYSDIRSLYLYRAINEFGKKQGRIFLYTEPLKNRFDYYHVDSKAYNEWFVLAPTLLFHIELRNLLEAQFAYLDKEISGLVFDGVWDNGILEKLVSSLERVDWGKYLPPGRNFEDYAEIIRLGDKGYQLRELKDKVKVPVPDFRIIKADEGLPAKTELFKKGGVVLYAVRSSPSFFPLPGLVDTVLNVGLTEEGIKLLAQKHGERLAYETYARFLRSFGTSVFKIRREEFKDIPANLNKQSAQELAEKYKRIIEGRKFNIPQDPYEQIKLAYQAVRDSWNYPQVRQYRQENSIPDEPGMAVIIQEMKFGNLDDNSGAFLLITRHDIKGTKEISIEYLPRRQPEDLVGGGINPKPLDERSGISPLAIGGIKYFAWEIEKEFREMQVIEGLMEEGKVWFLDTKDAVVSPEATVRIAVEMVEEGLITKKELFDRINLKEIKKALDYYQLDPQISANPIAQGEGVYPGAVSGVMALSPEKILEFKKQGKTVIWIKRAVIDPRLDYGDIKQADGLVVSQGGRLSHGALLGRSEGKPTIVGVSSLHIDERNRTVTIGEITYKEGDFITMDGNRGAIYRGELHLVKPIESNPYFQKLVQWYKEIYGKDI
jgi:phosphohistidine swiveling domain-containing protein